LLPPRSAGPLHLEDAASDASIDVRLHDVADVEAKVAEGYAVYAKAHASGASLLHRSTPDGVEDFVSFEVRPKSAEIAYDLTLGLGAAALRLVEGTLEIVDDGGAPRLRVLPPYIVGADGVKTDATLAVAGCEFDRNPAAPWGRAVTAPGAKSCTVRVTWEDAAVVYPAILDPSWTSTGSMGTARQEHIMVPFASGQVLVAGGRSSNTSTAALNTAQLFNPANGTWATTGAMAGARRLHRAVQLGSTGNQTTSGKVLVVGGMSGTTSVATAELYSPSAGTWTGAAALPSARHDGTATVLASGQVLVAGGVSSVLVNGNVVTTVLNTALRYNAGGTGTGTWTPVGSMSTARRSHTATLLNVPGNATLHNKVLVVGGNSGSAPLTSVQIFDGTSAWTAGPSLANAREGHTATAVANGVLIAGGLGVNAATLGTTLLFNPASGSGSFSSAGNMTTARSAHTATPLGTAILNSGQVVIAGGNSGTASLGSAELWNATNNTWTVTAALPSNATVQGHTAALLGNGTVLIAGGITGGTVQSAARIYDPSLALQCMNDSQCATGHCTDGVCCAVASCNGTCMACNVTGKEGTCNAKLAGTICNDNNACTTGETCQGGAQAGTCGGGSGVTCGGGDQCNVAGVCNPVSGCPAPTPKMDGTSCDDGHACTVSDSCQAGACQGSATNTCTAAVMDFDTLGTWSYTVPNGTVVGLNANHTQGTSSLEVKPHGFAPLISIPQSSIGEAGPLALLDIMLPTQQPNQFWFGLVQLYISIPSLGVNHEFVGQVELTGLPLGKWLTVAIQISPAMATKLSGSYTDLSFDLTLNVPEDQTASYLLDNLRFVSDIVPSVVGIATNSAGVVKAIFQYTTTNVTSINIPYGPANSLSNQNGFIADPPEMPPEVFVSRQHSPFAATMGTQLTWKVGTRSATATASSPQLPTTTGPDGSRIVTLPDGSKLNIDTVPPKDPRPSDEPEVGAEFLGALTGELGVSPTGAATYTVPISIPPGVAGMAPNLSLVYNSQGGNGIAGQGWEIGGLSMIHRCPKTKAVDGVMRPVLMNSLDSGNMDETDGLCLDGMHLFEDPVGSGKFRSEKESFGTIERVQGAFRVTTKSGEVRDYGSKLSSQIDIFVQGPGGHPFEAAVWGLDKVTDVWGNFYDVEYNNGSAFVSPSEGFQVTSIHYAGRVGDTQAPPNTITFEYDPVPRPDTRWIRFGHERIPKSKRLTAIVTPRGRYALTYQPTSTSGPGMLLPSVLQKIDYSAGGKSLKPLEFGWSQGGYGWQETPAFALPSLVPSSIQLKGVQFPDIDGDGRSDLVVARDGTSTQNSRRVTWTNTGAGWQIKGVNWWLPTVLVNSAGELNGVQFADIDGDGQLDIIQDHVDLTCFTPDACFVCFTEPGQGACSGTINHVSPAVWLNRFGPGQNQSWELHREYEKPASFLPLDFRRSFLGGFPTTDTLADIDGDKLPDIVRIQGGEQPTILVLLNQGVGHGWLQLPFVPLISGIPSPLAAHLEDINRDGLPDVVETNFKSYADGHLEADQAVWLNKGVADAGTGARISFRSSQVTFASAGGTPTPLQNPPSLGDIDGDGAHDATLFYDVNNGQSFAAGVGIGDGDGVGFSGNNALPYRQELVDVAPRDLVGESLMLADFGFSLVDINGDGLTDLVRNHANRFGGALHPNQGGGQLLLNTGTRWKDLNGVDTWQVSAGLNPVPRTPDNVYVKDGSAFVDLNGDGLQDLITQSPETHAWLNTYQPPVITLFPNQLAFSTIVKYVPITSAAARTGTAPTYTETGTVDPGTKRLVLPIRVVQSLTIDSPIFPGPNTQTYQYTDMRVSASDYGPQGFKTMTVTDATGLSTKTTYAQVYPYTALPIMVEKSNGGPITTTKTIYCTTNSFDDGNDCVGPFGNLPGTGQRAPRSTFFPRPAWVEDIAYLRSSTFPEPSPTFTVTLTTIQYDSRGNPKETNVTTQGLGENYNTITRNDYGIAGSDEERLGKPTRTVVRTQRSIPQGPPITHTTEFEYQTVFGALALSKKKVEPNAGTPIENHTAFDYDKFGNVITTTSCASDFSSCAPGAAGPPELPFRTTRVSFKKADFNAPVGPGLISALPYEDGRFPVMTTNALGHKEYSVYDPLNGALVQKTGPNGIHTCYAYDRFGNATAETSRCGSIAPITTTTQRFSAVPLPASPPLSKVVTVVRPPMGSPTWTYTDGFGRVVATRARHFDGTIIETSKSYDMFGRVISETRSHRLGDPVFSSVSTYDPLSRISTLTQDIGSLDGTSSPISSTTTTTYSVAATTISHVVGGTTQTRKETKNLVGKVIEVSDTDLKKITYAYDADGNLTDTFDPAGNTVHIDYDVRGRKIGSTDPDLGAWTFGYNGFGDLITQTDARNQTTTMAYDQLGRMASKADATGVAQWVYDVAPGAGVGKLAAVVSAPDTKLKAPCVIPFLPGAGGNRAGQSFRYTQFGDLEEESQCVDGDTFVTSYDHDRFGRQTVVRYPAINGVRLATESHYTSLGHLQFITDLGDGAVLWVAKEMNALGQVTKESVKNGVETTASRNAATGWLLGSQSVAHADGNKLIQKWDYGYDEVGNLLRRDRSDAVLTATTHESFIYDGINRLKTSTVETAGFTRAEQFVYDPIGNITQKNGQQYFYSTGCTAGTRPAGPHAVCSVQGGSSYQYDGNGNMTNGGSRSVAYNPSNKPTTIQSFSPTMATVEFAYGADTNRVLQIATSGGQAARTVYIGLGGTGKSLYERTSTSSTTQHAQFIYAQGSHGGAAFAIRVTTETGSSTKYYHFDHLGSVTAMSDERGRVVGSGADATMMSYDAWGLRRDPDGRPASTGLNQQAGRREFTGHEAITGVGLINMNGRVYDPVLGRFLSPDPTVQFVADLQSFNRYSYVHNNPLSYTDPTGFGLFAIFGIHGWLDTALTIGVTVVGIAVCAVSAGAGCAAFGMFMAFTSAFVTGASALSAGASPWQAIGLMGVSFVAGLAGGAAGNFVGGGLAGAIVGGAVSGATSAALTTEIMGGKDLGRNVLLGAAQGAAQGAAAWGLSTALTAVTHATVAEANGSGGSEEAQLEKTLQRNTGPAEKGESSKADSSEYKSPLKQGYDTPKEAARAALDLYNPLSEKTDREFAGLVYKGSDGKYYATMGMAGRPGEGSSSPYSAAALVPKDATLVGMYHTHARWDADGVIKGIDWNERFSVDGNPGDIAMAHRLPPPDTHLSGRIQYSYLATPSGRMLEYAVATRQISEVGRVSFLPEYAGPRGGK
jgi:RHS repeat-associated protein